MNIVLGVSGSVAAYRACDLTRELMRRGHTVRVCLTDAAQRFVTAELFEALSGQPCLADTFDEPERGRMAHIEWARAADLVLVAPATANTLVKLGFGLGDDMLTTLVLASTRPLIIAPAMNPTMWANEQVQEAKTRLETRGAIFVEPQVGEVACGEVGQGKFADTHSLLAVVDALGARAQRLAGAHVLITSGPTREPLDDVRYLTNRSSGKMGAALARAAIALGANVTVVSGPVRVAYPQEATVHSVETAEQMLAAAKAVAPNADWIIGAAAVSDYRPNERYQGKRRRSADDVALTLTPNPDILAELARIAPASSLKIGFAAEPSPDLEEARAKLVRKGLNAVAHNDVSRVGLGFDSDQNALTLLLADGSTVHSGERSKLACAFWLFETLLDSHVS